MGGVFILIVGSTIFFSRWSMPVAWPEEGKLRTTKTITYYLNPEANTVTETAVRETFERWEEATHFDFVYVGRHRAGLQRDRRNTISFLVRWPDGVPQKTAYCKNWYDLWGNIVESDIIFNMSIARFTTLQTHSPDSYYIEGVLAHEIGHMVGLGHIDSQSCLMKAFSPLQESYFMGRIDEETLEAYRRLYGY